MINRSKIDLNSPNPSLHEYSKQIHRGKRFTEGKQQIYSGESRALSFFLMGEGWGWGGGGRDGITIFVVNLVYLIVVHVLMQARIYIFNGWVGGGCGDKGGYCV